MRMENPRYTVCEVLREIWQETENATVKLKTRIAMTMAKKMNDKLMEYNKKWQEQWDGDTGKMRREIDRECKK